MSKHNLINVRPIHRYSASEQLLEWQKNNKTTPIENDDFVKIAFVQDTNVEWMWVHITDSISDVFIGLLANEPVVVDNVKYGDTITVNRSQIRELIKKQINFKNN